MSRLIKKIIKDIEQNINIDGDSINIDTDVVIDGHHVVPQPYNGFDPADPDYPSHDMPESESYDGPTGEGGKPIDDYEYTSKNPLEHDTPIVVRRRITEVITDFSTSKLQEYQNAGGIPYAIYKDGTKRQVEWSDVREIPKDLGRTSHISIAQIANAASQNFWTDDDGAHVTSDLKSSWREEYDEPDHGTLSAPTLQNPWHNILINSLGILLRRGLLNLAGLSKDAIVFYDGSGNTDSSIMAVFGASGAQIGKNNENHLVLSNTGVSAYDSNGDLIPVNASNIAADHAKIEELDAGTAKIQNGIITNATIDVADVNNLSTNYAHLKNGKIDNATIDAAKVNGLSANYAHITNGEIDNAKINVADVTDISANYAHLTNGVIDNAEINVAKVNGLSAAYATIAQLNAQGARIDNLVAVDISGINARIENIESDYITTDELEAATAILDELDVHYAQIDLANVNNAWIQNGVIIDGSITDAKIQDVSANKLTAGTIDASEITVTNLKAEDILVNRINGQTVTNKSVQDILSDHAGNIDDLDDKIDTAVSNLNSRIDAQIQTWTVDAVPTLNNTPANAWTTNALKNEHVGDICYVVNSANEADGYTYRFAYDTTTSKYMWVLIKDNQVTAALQRLVDAEGDISGLQTFQSNTAAWISNTDSELSSIKQNHTTLSTKVDKTLVSTTQLWFTKANTTAPNKPSAHVTTNNANTGNAWNIAVPTYNSSYPNYYYCYEWQYADGTYGWSGVTRDIAMGETQLTARNASTAASNAQTAASNAQSTADNAATAASNAQSTADNAVTAASNAQSTADNAATAASNAQTTANNAIKSTIQLWFTKANTTAPAAPTAAVTSSSTSGNAWRIVVPTYNASYPNYFYCYQYQKGDNSYSWSSVVFDRAMTEAQNTARTVTDNLATYISSNDQALSDLEDSLQSQIDGAVDIWYGTTDPTTSNTPASDWDTASLKDNHVGDLYYNTTNGHSWRFVKVDDAYSWSQIPNTDASAALSAAQNAQATADGKRRIFTSTPTVPYDIGDLWVNGSVVKYANKKRTSGSYTASEWTLTATDDTLAESNIKSTVQLWFTKANTTAPTAPTAHVTTNNASTSNAWNLAVPTYNSSYPYYYYCYEWQYGNNNYGWSAVTRDLAMEEVQTTARSAQSTANSAVTAASNAQSTADNATTAASNAQSTADNAATAASNAQSTADKKRRVFTTTPTVPYDIGDLWVDGNTVKYANKARTSGSYTASEWSLTATDDTAVDNLTIGGRNLLSNSGTPSKFRYDAPNAYQCASIAFVSGFDLVEGETYTVQLWGTNIGRTRFGIYVGGGSYPVVTWIDITDITDFYYARTFTATSVMVDTNNYLNIYASTTTGGQGSTPISGTFQVLRAKLERGNKPTDWSPAPEDVAADISAAQNTADGAATAASNAQTTANANIKSSVQLWFTKADSGYPNKPSSHISTNDASQSNTWNLAVPNYDSAYPYYFYCYEYQKGDGGYSWSDVIRNVAMEEAQANSRIVSISDGYPAGPISSLVAEGWAKQDTTSGKNLLNDNQKSAGYIQGSVVNATCNLANQNGTFKEWTSEYIPVISGESLTFQVWLDSIGEDQQPWIAYRFFSDVAVALTARVAKYGTAGTTDISYVGVTIPDGAAYVRVSWRGFAGYHAMLEYGSTATSYEIYTGGAPSPSPEYPQEIRVARGRNLLYIDPSKYPTTKADVTFTMNEDGSITASGTATGSAYLDFGRYSLTVPAGTYYYTPATGSGFKQNVFEQGESSATLIINSAGVFTLDHEASIFCRFGAPSGNEINATIYPQLEVGSTLNPYVPYGHVGLEVQGKNLLDEETIEVGSLNSTGSFSSVNTRLRGRDYFVVDAGVAYTLSGSSSVGKTLQGVVAFYTANDRKTTRIVNVAWVNLPATFDAPSGSKYATVLFRNSDDSTITTSDVKNLQLERGSVATDYEPYYHSTTPVPLPSKGFAGALPDGTHDTLALDGAGKVTWGNATKMVTEVDSSGWVINGDQTIDGTIVHKFIKEFADKRVGQNVVIDGSVICDTLHSRDSGDTYSLNCFNQRTTNGKIEIALDIAGSTLADLATFLAAHPTTFLYPLATPTVEDLGYIDIPDVPIGGSIHIPELENLELEYYVNPNISQTVKEWGSRSQNGINYVQEIAENAILSTTQLWFTKSTEALPTAPTTHVTTANANTGNAWNKMVPTYNASYPFYFYCYEYLKGDNKYYWSEVVYDRATSENQQNARNALTQVSTKVESSTFNTLSQTVSTMGNTITSLSTEVSNIEVGGRNLISGYDADDVFTKTGNSSNYVNILELTINRVLGVNEYVLSFDAKASAACAIICYWYNPNTTIDSLSSTGSHITNADGYCQVTLTTDWQRYWVKWKQSDTADTAKHLLVGRIPKGTTDTVDIRRVKFETGNMPTDWTPATEDMATADSVTTVSNTVNQVEQTANSNLSKISNLTTRLGTNADGTQNTNDIVSKYSSLEQDLSGFKTTVSSTYTTQTNFNNEVNQRKATYVTSTTAAATAAKVGTCANFVLYTGAQITCTFSNANTAATPTLNVNSTGAKQIRSYTGGALSDLEYKWAAGSAIDLVYDGTYWRLQDSGSVKRIGEAETQISQNTEAIALRATKTEVAEIAKTGIEYIVGTQTESTGSWTGVTRDSALYSGKMIAYYLPFATPSGSTSTLNLTLSGGGTTGAKNVRINNSNVTTHFPQYSVINLTWDGTYWKTSNYDSNNYDRTLYNQAVKAADGISAARIVCGTSAGYKQIAAGLSFDLAYPLLYSPNAITANATRTDLYSEIPNINFSNNGSIDAGAAYKMIFLRGTISNNTFTISTAPFMTTTPPSTKDDLYYIPLGLMISSTNGRFISTNRLYKFYNGAFQPVDSAIMTYATAQFEVQAGLISARVEKNGVISAINQSAESVTIDASKININGVITAGSIAKTSNIPTKLSQLTNDSNYGTTSQIATAKSEAISAAATDATSKANTAKSEAISAAASNASTAISQAIDNLQVGGRNLLLYSKPSEDNLLKVRTNQYSSFVTEDGYPCYKIIHGGTASGMYASCGISIVALAANTTYIYSAWVKVTHPTETTNRAFNFTSLGHFTVLNNASTKSDNTHEDIVNERIFNPSSIPMNQWTRIELTFTTNELDHSYFGVYPVYNLASDYIVYLRDQKLEKGNKATDWSPAPEDVDAQLTDIFDYANEGRAWYATCTTAAATAAKVATITPTTTEFTLQAGATVHVKFDVTNSTNTALTLNVNGTGAKSIKYIYNNTLANIPSAGYLVANFLYQFTYDGTYWVIQNFNYNTNNIDRTNVANNLTIKSNPGGTWRVMCGDGTGYFKVEANVEFDYSYPILTFSVDPTNKTFPLLTNTGYSKVSSLTVTNTAAIQSAAVNKMLYLKGTVSGYTFKVAASNFFTTVIPTTADGYFYIPLGIMYSTTGIYFNPAKELYAFIDGKFRQVTPTEVVATQYIYHSYASGTATSSVTGYSTWITANGDTQNAWTTKRPTYNSSYPVLFIVQQTKRLDGSVVTVGPVKDDTLTVIDGGHITTGTIDASAVTVDNIDAANIKSGYLSADRINASSIVLSKLATDVQTKIANGDNAKTAIDNLEIGGRNLFKDSLNLVNGWAFENSTSAENGIATIPKDKRIYQLPASGYWGAFEVGETYVASIEAKGASADSKLNIKFIGGDNANNVINLTTEWKRYNAVCVVPSGASVTGSMSFYSSTDTSYVRLPKLEKGNRATDWTPAPEDTNGDISYLTSSVSALQDTPLAYYGTCNTAATTAAKVVTCNGFKLVLGVTITVYHNKANTLADALTLNVNNTGDKPIYTTRTEATSSTNQLLWNIKTTITYVYDGTNWIIADNPGSYIATTCTIAEATQAKTAEANERTIVVYKGTSVTVPMANANTNAEATLNISGLGAKPIYYGSGSNVPTKANAYSWLAGSSVIFIFDGANWRTGNQTFIDANGIITGYISADRIQANSLGIGVLNTETQNKINAGNTAKATLDSIDISTIPWIATSSTAAGTAAKEATITPATTNFTLQKGVSVNVTFAATNTATDITLNVNGTGAKGIRYINNGVVSTLPNKGYLVLNNLYHFTYDGTYWVLENLNYNSDTYDRTRYNQNVIAADAITAAHLICADANGYKNLAAGVSFDLSYPILYAATTIAAGATSGTRSNNYLAIAEINYSTTGAITSGANGKTIYLVGTVVGNIFTVKAANFFTTVEPTSGDGYYYIPLGIMTSATNGYFASTKQLYAFIDSEFQSVDMGARSIANNALAAATAYGTCSTAASTSPKVIVSSEFKLVVGAMITVKFSTAGTVTNTVALNVNNTGAKNVYIAGDITSSTNQLRWGTGAFITFRYDGTGYVVIGEPRSWFAKSSTAADVASKKDDTLGAAGVVICKGTVVNVTMANANSVGSPKLNVQSTGDITIHCEDAAISASSALNWSAKATIPFVFNGSLWDYDGNGARKAAAAYSKAVDSGKTATDYLTFVTGTGLDVGYSGSNAKTRISTNGIELFGHDGSSLGSFQSNSTDGALVRVGKSDIPHVEISPTTFSILSDSTNKLFNIDALNEIISLGDQSTNGTKLAISTNGISLGALVRRFVETESSGSYQNVYAETFAINNKTNIKIGDASNSIDSFAQNNLLGGTKSSIGRTNDSLVYGYKCKIITNEHDDDPEDDDVSKRQTYRGRGCIALGVECEVTANNNGAIAIGYKSKASGSGIAIGNYAEATSGIAIGGYCSGGNSVACGGNSYVHEREAFAANQAHCYAFTGFAANGAVAGYRDKSDEGLDTFIDRFCFACNESSVYAEYAFGCNYGSVDFNGKCAFAANHATTNAEDSFACNTSTIYNNVAKYSFACNNGTVYTNGRYSFAANHASTNAEDSFAANYANGYADDSFAANHATTNGEDSFAANYATANGEDSFAANHATANAVDSFAANYATAQNSYSAAFGYGTSTSTGGTAQLVCGQYNSPASNNVFEIGWGNSSTKKNIFNVRNTGSVYANSTQLSSDIRIKTNILDLDKAKAVEFIKTLQPKSYEKNDIPELGFIAQEVEETEYGDILVSESENYGYSDFKSLNYTALIAPTIAALQNALERIDILETKVSALEEQNKLLKEIINHMNN